MQQQIIEPDVCTGKFDMNVPPLLFGKVPPEQYQNAVSMVNNAVNDVKKDTMFILFYAPLCSSFLLCSARRLKIPFIPFTFLPLFLFL